MTPFNLLGAKSNPRERLAPEPGLLAQVTDRRTNVLILIGIAMFAVFVVDVVTPPDDVSICFVYAVLVSISILSFRGAAYPCALLATVLSCVGAFVQQPHETQSLVFFGNRAIAIMAQWLVALVVTARKDAEALVQSQYETERVKVDTGRRFIAILSHEIGTSLTAIDGHAFRLLKIDPAPAADDTRSRAEKIRGAVRHIEGVVRQVQIASEVETGNTVFECAEMDLAGLISDVAFELKGERDIQIDAAGLPPTTWANPEMMRQVIANLVSNAIKYSRPDTPISVWGRREDRFAAVSISDRGIGIPEGELSKLVEPYYRASNSRGVPGTGIGLFVVQRYVARHGGTVDIDSALGVGTTVTIRIPVKSQG